MYQCNDSTCRKPDILETEPDIKQHTDRSNDHSNDCIHTHLRTYCGTDIFSCNIFCLNTIILIQIRCESLSLCQIQRLRLKYNLVRSLYRLNLDILISGDLFHTRDHIFIDLIKSIFFIKCNIRGCSSDKVKAVVHCPDSPCMVHAHHDRSAQAEDD